MISEDVFDDIWDHDGGQLFLVNLANQFQANIINHEFLDTLNSKLSGTSKPLWECLADECKSLEYFLSDHSSSIGVNRLLRVAPWASLLKTVKARDPKIRKEIEFLRNDFDEKSVGLNSSNIDLREKGIEENFLTVSEPGILGSNWLSCEFSKPISLKPINDRAVFCTSTSTNFHEAKCFDSASMCGRNKADLARDILGLVHYDNTWSGVPFIPMGAFYFKFDKDAQTYARPTVIEARNHSRFKSTYGDLGESLGSWGRAIDLSNLDDGGQHGGREIIVRDFKPDSLHFTFLGFVRVPRGDVNGINDNKFLTVVLNGQDRSMVRKILTS